MASCNGRGVFLMIVSALVCSHSVDLTSVEESDYENTLPKIQGYKILRTALNSSAAKEDLLGSLNISTCFTDIDSKDKVGDLHWWRNPKITHPEDIGIDKLHVDILVSPQRLLEVQNVLATKRIPTSTLVHDVHRLFKRATPRKWGKRIRMHWKDYQTHDVINRFLERMDATAHFASMEVIGKSFEGRELKVLKINTNNANKAFWIDGGIHAREWISPAVVTYIIKEFVRNYRQHKEVVDAYQWYFLPVVNPDGYEHSRTRDRMWRKTRSRLGKRSSCVGVDPNRNWNYKWMVSGSSSNPCSEVFAGPYPESEKSVIAVRDFVMKKLKTKKDVPVLAFYTFHSFYQGWMSPWGWTNSQPKEHNDLIRVAKAGVKAIKKVHGTRFAVGTAAALTGQASGASDDWAYAVAKIPFVYTIELRDTGSHGFALPPSLIEPSGREMVEGVKASALEILKLRT